ALVPDVVAQGDRIHPRLEDGLCQRRRDTRPGGGVFAIRDHEVDLSVGSQRLELPGEDIPTWAADDIANEEDVRHANEHSTPNTQHSTSKSLLNHRGTE